MSERINRAGVFYGWWVVAAVFVVQIMAAGLGFYAFSVFFKAFIEEFGWSRTAISGASSASVLILAALGPLIGWAVDRYGAQKVMLLGLAMLGLRMILLSRISALWHLYAFHILLAFGSGPAIIPAQVVISNWFSRRRGLAMGLAMAGTGIGGLIMAPGVQALISRIGWRGTFLISGLIVCAVAIPVVWTLVKDRPQDHGLLPDGDDSSIYAMPAVGTKVHPVPVSRDWSLRQATRTKALWALAGAFFLISFGQSSILVHEVVMISDVGIPIHIAAMTLGLTAGMGIAGKLGLGYLADKLNVRYVAMVGFSLQAVGIFILMHMGSMVSLYFFVLIFGFAMGSTVALRPLLISNCFGLSSLGAILGFLGIADRAGGAIGPIFAGYVFDTLHSYHWALITFIGTSLLAAVCVSFAYTPESVDRMRG